MRISIKTMWLESSMPQTLRKWRLDRKETNAILRECIDRLSPAHREIIHLVYYHEQSVAEASVIVGIPVATVKSRMFFARKYLAKMLVSAGFEAAAVRTSVDRAKEARRSRGSHLYQRVARGNAFEVESHRGYS